MTVDPNERLAGLEVRMRELEGLIWGCKTDIRVLAVGLAWCFWYSPVSARRYSRRWRAVESFFTSDNPLRHALNGPCHSMLSASSQSPRCASPRSRRRNARIWAMPSLLTFTKAHCRHPRTAAPFDRGLPDAPDIAL